MLAQLRWCDHVVCMPDDRIPKQLLYGELVDGQRRQGSQKKRFKDSLGVTLKSCGIPQNDWAEVAADRAIWRSRCRASTSNCKQRRVKEAIAKRAQRKTNVCFGTSTNSFICNTCSRTCGSMIGVFSHQKSHTRHSSHR